MTVVSRLTIVVCQSGTKVRARRTGKHPGDVLKQLKSAVERPAGNHVQSDVRITVIDPVVASAPGDHGEDDHPESIHEACLEERPAQG